MSECNNKEAMMSSKGFEYRSVGTYDDADEHLRSCDWNFMGPTSVPTKPLNSGCIDEAEAAVIDNSTW